VFPQDDRLWVEKYEPQCLKDLAVHKRKVDDVRRWLAEAFGGRSHPKHRVGFSPLFWRPRASLTIAQRLLILSGPAGSAKTATMRVLAREMDFEITEYKNNTDTIQFSAFTSEPSTCRFDDFIA
jgi:cell cycle checkpoint protein